MASTIGRPTADDRVPAMNGTRRGRLAGRQVVMSVQPLTRSPGERARLLVSIPATPTTAGIDSRLLAIVLLGLVVVCVVATLLGSVLARLVSRPLGELARAFERMRVELGEYLSALRSSRDELARSMNRLGETLSSTHDLPKLLAVVLEAAVQARRAKAGSLLLLTADRTALVREATYGLQHRDPAERIPVGQGVAGTGWPASPSTQPLPRSCCGPPTRHTTRPSSRAATGWSPPGPGCCR
jgi:two-component system cell cycle response regulator